MVGWVIGQRDSIEGGGVALFLFPSLCVYTYVYIYIVCTLMCVHMCAYVYVLTTCILWSSLIPTWELTCVTVCVYMYVCIHCVYTHLCVHTHMHMFMCM